MFGYTEIKIRIPKKYTINCSYNNALQIEYEYKTFSLITGT